MSRFSNFYSVGFTHPFYPNDVMEDLVLEPTQKTAQSLDRHGLLYRLRGNELGLYFDSEGRSSEKWKSTLEELDLAFAYRSRDSYFRNFTIARGDASGNRIFYDTNLESAGGNRSAIDLRPLAFQWELESSDQGGSVEIFDHRSVREGNPLVTYPIEKDQDNLQIDLRQFGSGWYQIRRDGSLIANLWADDALYSDPPFGVFEFVGRAFSEDTAEKTFSISFETRSTRWVYFLFNWKFASAEGLQIRPPGDASPERITFVPTKSKTFANGQTALAFISEQSLPMQQKPKYNFEMIFSMSGANGAPIANGAVPNGNARFETEETIFPVLPFPDLNLSRAGELNQISDDLSFQSEIFLYYRFKQEGNRPSEPQESNTASVQN